MYTLFSELTWIVLNICILFIKVKSVKFPNHCLYTHAFLGHFDPKLLVTMHMFLLGSRMLLPALTYPRD